MAFSSKEKRMRFFRSIPIWKKKRKFQIIRDSHCLIDSVPVTRIESWEDWVTFLNSSFFSDPDNEYIFRGQRNFQNTLTPSLGRLHPDDNGVIYEELANEMLDSFKKSVRGRSANSDFAEDEANEIWAVGQHHGLATPLLDWTHSPYVALFFAFENHCEYEYRTIYILNKSFVEKLGDITDYVRLIQPKKDEYGRLVNQAGLFSLSSYGVTLENQIFDILMTSGEVPEVSTALEDPDSDEAEIISKYICKVFIRNNNQFEILEHLKK